MEKNSRVCVIQYETPIIIPRGSNPHNPFAEDTPSKKDRDFVSEIITFIFMLTLFGLILAVPFSIANDKQKAQNIVLAFSNGKDIWCKLGREANTDIRINKNEGWEYRSKDSLFINKQRGVAVELNVN